MADETKLNIPEIEEELNLEEKSLMIEEALILKQHEGLLKDVELFDATRQWLEKELLKINKNTEKNEARPFHASYAKNAQKLRKQYEYLVYKTKRENELIEQKQKEHKAFIVRVEKWYKKIAELAANRAVLIYLKALQP